VTALETRTTLVLGREGISRVEPDMRLDRGTHIQCCTYEEHAPILAISAGDVRLTMTVPDVRLVTDKDVKLGRALAAAVTRYVAELERRAAVDQPAAGPEGLA
jgi:hypothetical protein